MSIYYKKPFSEFKEGDSACINGETVHVISVRHDRDTITLILSGGYNRTGNRDSFLETYSEPPRKRRTKREMAERRELEAQIDKNNGLYLAFMEAENISNNLKDYTKIEAGKIIVGDIIRRGKKLKAERIFQVEDLGDEVYLKGFMGWDDNTPDYLKDMDTLRKTQIVYKFIKNNGG